MDDSHLVPSSGAPSYALESDSEEEQWWDDSVPGSAPPPSKEKVLAPEPLVQVSKKPEVDKHCVFLVGEAGERIAKGVRVGRGISVKVDGEKVGSVHYIQSSETNIVYLSPALPLAALFPLAHKLLAKLAPSGYTIVTSYHAPSYIPASTPPPILYLQSQHSTETTTIESLQTADLVRPFAPPNLIHGLAASLLLVSSPGFTEESSVLLSLPTTLTPPSLNGTSYPSSHSFTSNTSYDAGGPTGLSEWNGGWGWGGEGLESWEKVVKAFGWTWWTKSETKGDGFAWVEEARKEKLRAAVGNMYM